MNKVKQLCNIAVITDIVLSSSLIHALTIIRTPDDARAELAHISLVGQLPIIVFTLIGIVYFAIQSKINANEKDGENNYEEK